LINHQRVIPSSTIHHCGKTVEKIRLLFTHENKGASQFCNAALIPNPSPVGEGSNIQSPSPSGEGFRVRATKVGCTLKTIGQVNENYLKNLLYCL
jgi:hypothetical protein